MHADAMDKPGGSVNKPSFFSPVIAFLEMQFTPRAIHPLQVHSTRVFSVGTELDNHHHPQCRGDPRPISSHPRFPAPASLRQLLTFQSRICPFQTFHVHGLLCYVVFCVCLLCVGQGPKVHW